MRILHVSEVSWGGVVSLVRVFTAQQVARGHEVSMLAPSAFPSLPSVEQRPWTIERRQPRTYPVAVAQLRAAVSELKPDIVHLHSFMAGFVGRLPGVIPRDVPIVYQPHAWSFELRRSRAFGTALRTWERAASSRAQVLATNCQDEIDEGRRVGVNTPGHVIGVPIDAGYFHPVEPDEVEPLRTELGLSSNRVLLCIGRLARQKGQDMLVKAWEADPICDCELVLVGPGDTGTLERLAPSQWGQTIRAVGESRDVRPWLWASDLLVLPSRYETVAVVVGEAMASGRAVVATDVNGAREVLTEGDLLPAGAIAANTDMKMLLLHCRRLLDDAARREAMADAALERTRSLFSPDLIGDRLEGAYKEAVALAPAGHSA